ncbi:hypothetical protein B0H14DRAFT_2574606 [Mycena olivaceomarginata]|nr:hypothetical protein B0H14DRAFT_2574606 [Mycena olivaceomarginata]
MPAVQSRLDSHHRNVIKATEILQNARTEAAKSHKYESAPTRAKIHAEFIAPVLAAVHKSVDMNPEMSYLVNLGTDRPNIAWFVHHMKAAKADLEALKFILPQRISEDEPVVLTQSMLFIDDISLLMDALKHLCDRLPPRYHSQIAVYHSKRSKRLKRIIMEKFRSGEIKILLTTEATGMHVPGDEDEEGEPPPKDSDPVTFRRTVEGLWAWIETDGCRRDVADEYLDNGTIQPTGICCDNCLRKTSPSHPLLLVHSRVEPDQLAERPTSPSSDNKDSPSQTPRENGKQVMRPATEAPNRRDQHLKDARALLTNWQDNTCATIYRRRPWGPE